MSSLVVFFARIMAMVVMVQHILSHKKKEQLCLSTQLSSAFWFFHPKMNFNAYKIYSKRSLCLLFLVLLIFFFFQRFFLVILFALCMHQVYIIFLHTFNIIIIFYTCVLWRTLVWPLHFIYPRYIFLYILSQYIYFQFFY